MLPLFRLLSRMPREERWDGQFVYLRPPSDEDWAEWAELRAASRAFLVPWEPSWSADCLARPSYRRRLSHYGTEWHNGTGYAFFIFGREDDRLCGGITLSNVRRGVAQTGTLGYWIGAPFARRGLMTDALYAIMRFSFDGLNLHRLEAACLPRNTASRSVLQKTGFREEGYAPKFLCINGLWEDHLLFGLLDEEALHRRGSGVRRDG